MSQLDGDIIVIASPLYLDFLTDAYGKDHVHSPIDTEAGGHDIQSAFKQLLEAADETQVITFVELNQAMHDLTWQEIVDLLAIAEGHGSGLVVYKDTFTNELAMKIEGVLKNPHVTLDAAKKEGSAEIRSAINSLLESPGPFNPELE